MTEIPNFADVLRYDRTTGKFYWIKKTGTRRKVGQEAGYINKQGRCIITYLGRYWGASRLAWYFVYGCLPDYFIDHINGDAGDNRIENLREATPRENAQNKPQHRSGKLVGTYKRPNNKWSAKIIINGKTVHLGTFDTEQQASDKYWAAVESLPNERKQKEISK